MPGITSIDYSQRRGYMVINLTQRVSPENENKFCDEVSAHLDDAHPSLEGLCINLSDPAKDGTSKIIGLVAHMSRKHEEKYGRRLAVISGQSFLEKMRIAKVDRLVDIYDSSKAFVAA